MAAICVFQIQALPVVLVLLVLTVAGYLYLRGPGWSLLRSCTPLAMAMAVIWFACSLRFDGTATWPAGSAVGFSADGMVAGGALVCRFVLLAFMALLVNASTTVEDLAQAAAALLRPLGKLGIPTEDAAMLITLSLRCIPICLEQVRSVADAQRARGARIGRGNPVRRILSWTPVLVPVSIKMFKRAEALAHALFGRMYRSAGRTHLKQLKLRTRDAVVLAGTAALMMFLAVMF